MFRKLRGVGYALPDRIIAVASPFPTAPAQSQPRRSSFRHLRLFAWLRASARACQMCPRPVRAREIVTVSLPRGLALMHKVREVVY